MRPILVNYLVENGGYEAELTGDDSFYLCWGRGEGTQKKYEENNKNVFELTNIKTNSVSLSKTTTTPQKKKQKTTTTTTPTTKKKGKNIALF